MLFQEDDCVIADIDLNSSGEVPAGPDTSNGPRSLFQTVSKRDITGALYDENWLILSVTRSLLGHLPI